MAKPAQNPIADLLALIERGEITRDIMVNGKKFTLRSLFDEDYTWRDSFVNMSSDVGLVASLRAPTLAISCIAIDDVPVASIDGMFDRTDVPDQHTVSDKFLIAYNLYRKLFARLPRPFTVELYQKFLEEVEMVSKQVMEEDLKNSSASTQPLP